MINKNKFTITNNKKILHKVGKNWVVISALTLGILGAGATTSTAEAKADTQPIQPSQSNASSQASSSAQQSMKSTSAPSNSNSMSSSKVQANAQNLHKDIQANQSLAQKNQHLTSNDENKPIQESSSQNIQANKKPNIKSTAPHNISQEQKKSDTNKPSTSKEESLASALHTQITDKLGSPNKTLQDNQMTPNTPSKPHMLLQSAPKTNQVSDTIWYVFNGQKLPTPVYHNVGPKGASDLNIKYKLQQLQYNSNTGAPIGYIPNHSDVNNIINDHSTQSSSDSDSDILHGIFGTYNNVTIRLVPTKKVQIRYFNTNEYHKKHSSPIKKYNITPSSSKLFNLNNYMSSNGFSDLDKNDTTEVYSQRYNTWYVSFYYKTTPESQKPIKSIGSDFKLTFYNKDTNKPIVPTLLIKRHNTNNINYLQSLSQYLNNDFVGDDINWYPYPNEPYYVTPNDVFTVFVATANYVNYAPTSRKLIGQDIRVPVTQSSDIYSNITVNYIDNKNNKLINQIKTRNIVGNKLDLQNYEQNKPYKYIDSPNFPGYHIDNAPQCNSSYVNGFTATYTNTPYTITIYVEPNTPSESKINITYKDTYTNQTIQTITKQQSIGTTYNPLSNLPKGYYLDAQHKQNTNVSNLTFNNNPQNITVYVKKDSTININYKDDKHGNQTVYSYQVTKPEGTQINLVDYNHNIPEKYQLDGNDNKPVTVQHKDTSYNVNVKQITSSTITLVYEDVDDSSHPKIKYTKPMIHNVNSDFDIRNYTNADYMPKGYVYNDAYNQTANNNIIPSDYGYKPCTIIIGMVKGDAINVQYLDNNNYIVDEDTTLAHEGTEFNDAKYKQNIPDGYQFDKVINQVAKYKPGTQTEIIKVKPIKYYGYLYIKYVDRNGKQIQGTQTRQVKGVMASDLDLQPYLNKIPTGYRYVGLDDPNKLSTGETIFDSRNSTIKIIVRKNIPSEIKVQYIDTTNGHTVKPETSDKKLVGNSFQLNTPPTIKGYSFSGIQNNTNKFKNETQIITINYTPIWALKTNKVNYTINGQSINVMNHGNGKDFGKFASDFTKGIYDNLPASDTIPSDSIKFYLDSFKNHDYVYNQNHTITIPVKKRKYNNCIIYINAKTGKPIKNTDTKTNSDLTNLEKTLISDQSKNQSYVFSYKNKLYLLPVNPYNNHYSDTKNVSDNHQINTVINNIDNLLKTKQYENKNVYIYAQPLSTIGLRFVRFKNGKEIIVAPNTNNLNIIKHNYPSMQYNPKTMTFTDTGIIGFTHDINASAYNIDTVFKDIVPPNYVPKRYGKERFYHPDISNAVVNQDAIEEAGGFNTNPAGNKTVNSLYNYLPTPYTISINIAPKKFQITFNYYDDMTHQKLGSETSSDINGAPFNYKAMIKPKGYIYSTAFSNHIHTYTDNNQVINVPLHKLSTINIIYYDNKGNIIKSNKITEPVNDTFSANDYLASDEMPKGYNYNHMTNGINQFTNNNQTLKIYMDKIPTATDNQITVQYIDANTGQQIASDVKLTRDSYEPYNYKNNIKQIKDYTLNTNKSKNLDTTNFDKNQNIIMAYDFNKLNHPSQSVGDIDVFYYHNHKLNLYRDYGSYPAGALFNLNAFKSAGFQILKGNNINKFNNGLQTVILDAQPKDTTLPTKFPSDNTIVPKSTITLNYIDNGKAVNSSKETKPVSTDYDVWSHLNIPTGYEYAGISNSNINHFTYNNQTINVKVNKIPNAKVAQSTITIDYTNNNKVISSTKITKPVSTDFDIDEYLSTLPNGYEYSGIKNDVDHFSYNDHTINIQLTKVPTPQIAKSTITINYINNGKVISSSKDTEPVSTDYDIGEHLNIPSGYEYAGMKNDIDNFGYNNHTIDVLVNKIPKPVVRKGIITVNYVSNGQTISSQSFTQPVGSDFNLNNNLDIPAGYEDNGTENAVNFYTEHTQIITVNIAKLTPITPSSSANQPSSKAQSSTPSSTNSDNIPNTSSSASKAPSSSETSNTPTPNHKSTQPSSANHELKPNHKFSSKASESSYAKQTNSSKTSNYSSEIITPNSENSSSQPNSNISSNSINTEPSAENTKVQQSKQKPNKVSNKENKQQRTTTNKPSELPQTTQDNNSLLAMISFLMGIVTIGYRDIKKHFE